MLCGCVPTDPSKKDLRSPCMSIDSVESVGNPCVRRNVNDWYLL